MPITFRYNLNDFVFGTAVPCRIDQYAFGSKKNKKPNKHTTNN